VAVVVLVRGFDEGLELGHVVRVSKVDHIDSNIVLPEALTEAFKFRLFFLKWVPTEDDNARLGILVHSVLE